MKSLIVINAVALTRAVETKARLEASVALDLVYPD